MEVISQYPPLPAPYGYPMPAPVGPVGPNMPLMNMASPLHLRAQQKLPVVVMPYRSKATDRKFRRRKKFKKIYEDSSSSSSSSESISLSSEHFRSRKRQKPYLRKKKRQVLTPVISYMTSNGDVVYQKKIKKDKAEDWLHLENSARAREDSRGLGSDEMTVRDLKHKYNLKWKRSKHKH